MLNFCNTQAKDTTYYGLLLIMEVFWSCSWTWMDLLHHMEYTNGNQLSCYKFWCMHHCTQWPLYALTMATSGSKKGAQGRDSVTQLDEQEAAFRLSLQEAFSDPAIVEKVSNIIKTANKDLVDNVSSLRTEVTSLRAALADRDAQIAALQSDVQHLKDAHDALEQHGRRHSLRINGVSNEQEDTTQAVVKIANDILGVDPPLEERDISVSHRLPTRRNAPPNQPKPIIVRFVSRADRDRVLKIRKNLKDYNEDKDTKLYINEDLTAIRAKLFSTARSLQKQRLLAQTWTFNGAIKVKTPEGVVHTATTSAQLKQLVPDADPRLFLWIQLPFTINMYSVIAPFIWQTIMVYILYDLFWWHDLCNMNLLFQCIFFSRDNSLRPNDTYGRIDWGQRWIRQWLVAWRHRAIAWANVELLLERFSGLQI